MEKNIYLKNYKLLKKENEHIFEELSAYRETKEEFDVCIYDNAQGNKGLYLDFAEKGIVQLGSQYIPDFYAEKWLEHYLEKNEIEDNAIFICFGIGSVDYLRALLERFKDNVVFIYEPSMKILDAVLRNIDLSGIINGKVFIMSSTDNGKALFKSSLDYLLDVSNYRLVKFIDLPNYNRIFRDKYNEYKDVVTNMMKKLSIEINTKRLFSKVYAENMLYSLANIPESYSLADLIETLPEKKPAVIISAGPSLQKNIKQLKLVKNKFFLVATDTALKPLLKEGIVPDIYVTADGKKKLELFDDERIKNIPFIAVPDSRKEVGENNKSKIFYSCGSPVFNAIIRKMEIGHDIKFSILSVGGSVATLALSFLAMTKLDPIIFVGQDLAYTGNKMHVDGAFKDSQEIKETDKIKFKYVEDIYGDTVPTVDSYDFYRRWFEDAIFYWTDHTYIDATEGGAKIKGTQIMTFREVMDRYDVEETDYEQLVNDMCPLFNVSNTNAYYKELLSFSQDLENIKDNAEKLLDCYKKVQDIGKEEIIDKDELIAQFSSIKKYTKYLDKETYLMSIIDMYMSTEAIVSSLGEDKIYDDIHEELENLSERSILKVSSIIKGVEELKPYVEKFVEEIQIKYDENLQKNNKC